MATPQNYLAVIKVVGVGGGGVNAITRMIEAGLKGVERDEKTKRVTQIGDIILVINNTPINTPDDLNTILKKFKPGDKINIKYSRINKEYKTDLILGNYKGATFTLLENERGKNFEEERKPVDIPLKNLEPVIEPKLN